MHHFPAMTFGLLRRSVISGVSAVKAATGNASTAPVARLLKSVGANEEEEEVSSCATASPQYDVFINHRGVDTRHTVARLLHDRLQQLSCGRVRPFLDNVSMRPGDRLEERINQGLSQCKVAVAIFSQRYLDSEFCLHELAELVEARKVIIPIFYGVKPSALVLPRAVVDAHAPCDVERFRVALHEARHTVGLAYDPAKGDLAELVSAAVNAVMQRIEQIESMQ